MRKKAIFWLVLIYNTRKILLGLGEEVLALLLGDLMLNSASRVHYSKSSCLDEFQFPHGFHEVELNCSPRVEVLCMTQEAWLSRDSHSTDGMLSHIREWCGVTDLQSGSLSSHLLPLFGHLAGLFSIHALWGVSPLLSLTLAPCGSLITPERCFRASGRITESTNPAALHRSGFLGCISFISKITQAPWNVMDFYLQDN